MAATYPIIRLNILNETITFQGAAVIEAETIQEIHPIGIELPASTARVRIWLDDTVEDENGKTLRDKFKPFGDGAYYQALSNGLPIDIYESVFLETGNIDGVYIGRFYLDSWKNPAEGEIEFECVDAIGVLDNVQYLGKFYEAATPVTTILNDIFNYTSLLYIADGTISGKTLSGYLPGNKSLRETLQQVLFAVGAYASTAGVDYVSINEGLIPIPGAVLSGYYFDEIGTLFDDAMFSDQVVGDIVSDSEKTDKQSLEIHRPVTSVEVVSHDYTKSAAIETIFSSEWLEPGDYLVVYQKPYWFVRVSGVGDRAVYLATAGGALLVRPDSGTYPDVTIFTTYSEFEFGTNYVLLHVLSPGGAVLVEGSPYVDNTQSFSRINPAALSSPINRWKIDGATLVQATNAADVLDKVFDYSKLNYTQQVVMFPYVDSLLGGLKAFKSLYGNEIVGVVRKIASDLTGGYLLDTEITGVERSVS